MCRGDFGVYPDTAAAVFPPDWKSTLPARFVKASAASQRGYNLEMTAL
jgi:hypothetical protein